MYCKHCGEQIDDNSKFCKQCGKNLDSGSAGISLPNISLGNFEFDALTFSIIGFIVTVILCFPTWISIRIPDLWSGAKTYSVSLFNLVDLFQGAADLSQQIDNEACNVLAFITIASWFFLALEAFILILFFISVYRKKRSAYLKGKVFSLLASVFSILFTIIVSIIGNDFSEASYDIIQISSSTCPIVIAIINIIAFVWLIIERRNLPYEDEEEDDEDDDFENQDYDDDLTDENSEEFWDELNKHSYNYYKRNFNKK